MKIITPAYKFVDYMGNRIPVPTNTRFIAMDKDGELHAFPSRPSFGGIAWWHENNNEFYLGRAETDVDSANTLVEVK